MASTIKALYGANAQAITCTLASLATGSARSALAIDNTSNLYLDVLVQVAIKVTTPSATGYINIYAGATTDGGTTYTDGGGTDAALTLVSPPNIKLIGRLNTPTNTATYKSQPMSVSAAFGGVLPDHWFIVIENQSGVSLDSTEGNHIKQYQGIQSQSI